MPTPNADELLARYDEQLRSWAELADCDEVVEIGPVLAGTFPDRGRGFVTYRSLGDVNGAGLDALVDDVVAHFARDPRVQRFEWKTRGHDRPSDLLDVLHRHGLRAEEPETVMVGDAAAVLAAAAPLPDGYQLQRADTEQQLRDAERLAGVVFGDDEDTSRGMADELVRRAERHPESFEMWTVLSPAGEVVCSGRVDFVDGTRFAGLWGGACAEAERGRGLYRALTGARAASAIEHGKQWLQSDCTEDSRPILARAGLVPVTTTTPVVWHRDRPAG